MQVFIDIALALGTLASLVFHYLGRKSATAEKIAEEIDSVEGVVKTVAPKA